MFKVASQKEKNVFIQETESERTEGNRCSWNAAHTGSSQANTSGNHYISKRFNTQTPPSDKRAGLNGRWRGASLETQGGADR